MTQANATFYCVDSSKLQNIDIADGNLIFVRDTRQIYLDVGSERRSYASTITLVTEEQRLNLKKPLVGYYFVKETGVYWYYDEDGWNQIADSSSINQFLSDEEELPEEGKEKTLYIKDNSIYKWNGESYDELGPCWCSF